MSARVEGKGEGEGEGESEVSGSPSWYLQGERRCPAAGHGNLGEAASVHPARRLAGRDWWEGEEIRQDGVEKREVSEGRGCPREARGGGRMRAEVEWRR